MKRTVRAGGKTIEYILIQSVRKNILLQVLPEGVIRVYAPKQVHLRDVDGFVRSKADQIAEMQRALDQKIDEERQSHPMTEGVTIMVEGQPRALHLMRGTPAFELNDAEIHLTVPNAEDEEAVRAQLRSALAGLALERICERLAYYAPKVGGQYGRVTIREQRTRWGSCSSKHNLNFNWKLIMAPKQVLDYVVIHELCHLHEFNHSPRFWALVEEQMPEYESWKKWLKVHGDELTL